MAMAKEVLVNMTPREVRVALLENGSLQEIHIERSLRQGLLGNIYQGRVNRLIPGIQAAFIDIGLERAAFLHVSDLGLAKDTDDYTGMDIRDYLQTGQEILVQVYKDELGSKGARLTTQFTIPSRFLVLTPSSPHIAVSQKITDAEERARLQNLLQPGPHGGFIFRTAAVTASQNEIDDDKDFLNALWAEILARAKKSKATATIHEEISIVFRILRDFVGNEVGKIRVDNKEGMALMLSFAQRYVPALAGQIEFYSDEKPIFDLYEIEAELQKSLQRKVYLRSGGHIVFDQTEAMTTIDVNTGSYLGKTNIEQTILRTNQEAAEVIARQVRLRNLGGIIIIDFIDMSDPAHKAELLQGFNQQLASDSAKTQISELSTLGLVQMTRKRTRESLEHTLCVQCPTCARRGSIKSVETVCYEVLRDLQRTALHSDWSGFMALVIKDLEIQVGKPIKWRAENSYAQEHFDILPLAKG
jgi:ribonuclease G